jgi:predicted MFS family arabinose efflux permease
LSLGGLFRLKDQLLTAPKHHHQEDSKLKVSDLLAIDHLKKVFVANLLISGAWDTHMFIVPIYGVEIGLSATTIGVVLSCFGVATLLIRTLLPLIQQRFQPWNLIHASMVTTTLIFLLYPFSSQIWLLTTLSFGLGLALGMTQTSILTLLQQHAPPGRASEAFGFRMALINGCQVTLPVGFGGLGAVIGVIPLFWAAALALMSGVWVTRHAAKDANDHSSNDPT